MSKKKKLPLQKPDAIYEVGYAKPPASTRFKPGQSGNPKGRPKGAKNKRPRLNEERLHGIVQDEAYRNITVRDGDRNVTVPMAQAVVRALAVNAAKGQHRAQRLFTEMLLAVEQKNKQLADEWLKTAIEYKVEWEKELQRREINGITCLPEPIPHPDHIKIDFGTGEVRVEGPFTKEEKAALDALCEQRDAWNEERDSLLEAIDAEENPKSREIMRQDIARLTRLLDQFDEKLGALGR
ncbi:DUF5681 domain-containing protein [Roseovarius aestuariivivens]|uniref:DUF5681 domain-containing protein n=1 Tax=Roseovarius aestuariivivens TaxID=1888910 RepID=UPI001081137C|nr:DUF5681 domain-containing protein [Roseovarius aestuariivivens]